MWNPFRKEAPAPPKVPISQLNSMPAPSIYQRDNGELWIKLNDESHVKVKLENGNVIGDGCAEALDRYELVIQKS